MMLMETTPVPPEAIPVAQFKEHLRLGTGFSGDDVQDGVLAGFLRAAIAAIEARTGKILIEREFSWEIGAWRDPRAQALPVAPVSAVTEVVLVGENGDESPVAPGWWRLVPDMQRPVLAARGTMLPPVPQGGSVRIGFLAGFGPEFGDLPADLAQAVMLLAAHYHEYRHEMALGPGCMPFGVSALIERYRTVRLFGGGQ